MSDAQTVATDKVVSLEYTLKDDEGRTLDESGDGAPLDYLHGHGNIVPGLERKVSGSSIGDEIDVVVDPADGYGEREGQPKAVPREAFPEDAELHAGMHFVAQNPDGSMMPLWVIKVEEDKIYVDPNHPLSGVRLHFSVKVVSIRDATPEELEHGHVHGPDDHHH